MSDVLTELHRLLPESRSIPDRFHLTTDAVISALHTARKDISLTRIPSFDDGNWNDVSLSHTIFFDHMNFHRGPVFIHTPACSRYDLMDFVSPADRLMSFISEYQREMLFDGDVLFVAPDSATLTLFHHEGAFAHVQL